MGENTSRLGRPMKSATRRIDTTAYIAMELLDAINEYVEQQAQTNRDYSRSDFFNEAAKHYLDSLKDGADNGTGEEVQG